MLLLCLMTSCILSISRRGSYRPPITPRSVTATMQNEMLQGPVRLDAAHSLYSSTIPATIQATNGTPSISRRSDNAKLPPTTPRNVTAAGQKQILQGLVRLDAAHSLASSTIPRKMPPSRARSSEGVPRSASSPPRSTSTLSLSMIVCSRCAIVSVVAPLKQRRTASWTAASVAESRAAVASSSTTSFELRSTARAIATICRCPAERFCPPSLISKHSKSSTLLGSGSLNTSV
mmetsp:Transcript_110013/g.350382  ORF Transcript_110013/g.350382 Transcript_110013/m.350382 type:complete len:233 (+) Transcript_110013:23-721(+)